MTHDKAFIVLIAEVGEKSVLSTMPVQVKGPHNVAFVVDVLNVLPDLLALNGLQQAWAIPAAIEIIAHQVGP